MSIRNKIRSLFTRTEMNREECEEKVAETITISKKHAFFLKELVRSSKGSNEPVGVNVSEILADLEEGKLK